MIGFWLVLMSTLLLVFGPKLWIIYFKPHKNSSDATGQELSARQRTNTKTKVTSTSDGSKTDKA
jgi:hypothetical protein